MQRRTNVVARKSRRRAKNRDRTRAVSRRSLLFESLEDRRLLATIVWDGEGGNSNWTTGANWAGDVAPTTNDDLVFPAGATVTSSVNDFVGESFGSILIEGRRLRSERRSDDSQRFNHGWGNRELDRNGPDTGVVAGMANTGTGTVRLRSPLNLNGNALSVSNSGGGEVALNDSISGTGGVSFSGNGTAVLAAANSYTGETLVSGGTLVVQDGDSLGTADGTSATGNSRDQRFVFASGEFDRGRQ